MEPASLLDNSSEVRLDERDRPSRIRGEFILPQADSVDDAVVAFLATHANELALPTGDRALGVVHSAKTPTGHVVRLQQELDGIPIFGSEMIVVTDEDQHVTQVELHRESRIRAQEPATDAKRMTPKQALKKAVDALPGEIVLRSDPPAPSLVYYPSATGLRLAYLVLLPTRDPHDWRVIIDAHEGEVLDLADLIVRYDGQGMVFDPNPVVTANNAALRDPAATVTACGFAGSSQATIDAQRVSRPLRDITLSGGMYRLEGPFARVHDFAAPANTFPQESDPNAFNYPSNDSRFNAVNVYFHIDTMQRYLQSLGITTAHAGVIEADPQDDSSGGAFFSPADGGLHFGLSGACNPDRATDGECIYHEYGHAIQHDQVPTWGGVNPVTGRNEARAMGEGFGDALACIFTATKGGGFGREVFEDWIFGNQGGLRRVDGTKIYPTSLVGEEHDDGEIWSAALWNAYRASGGDAAAIADREAARDAIIKTVVLSHHRLAGNASMPDAAEAVLVENAALPEYRGKQLRAFLASFHDRGILPCSAATDLYIRDGASDPGVDLYTGPAFWNSPDLWIRNADDNGTAHQAPEYGQDNWFYARVTNRGTATARAFVVNFNVRLWAGTEFVYPGDWDPSLSAAVGFNLAPGASTIVKAKWPQASVPAPGSHACWLAAAWTPVEASPAGRHTWESNNLAQKNLTIVDLKPNDSILVDFQLGSRLRHSTEQFRIEIRRPEKYRSLQVALVSPKPEIIERLFTSIEQIAVPEPQVELTRVGAPVLHFPDPSEVEIAFRGGEASMPVRLNLGAHSMVELGGGADSATDRRLLTNGGSEMQADYRVNRGELPELGTIAFHPGLMAGMPVALAARTPIPVSLRITAPPEARPGDSFDVDVIQRNADDTVIGGITVRVNVVGG